MQPFKPLYAAVLSAQAGFLQDLPELSAQTLTLQLLFLLQAPEADQDFWQSLDALQGTPADLRRSPEGGAQWLKHWSALGEARLNSSLQHFRTAWNRSPAGQRPLLLQQFLSSLPELLRGRQLRRAQGLYYTPAPLVRALCQQALQRYCQRSGHPPPALNRPSPFRFCDPACGSGQLLAGLLEQLQGTAKGLAEPEIWLENCFGVDCDPLAVLLTRWRIWQQVGQPAGVAPLLESRIRQGNTLSDEVLWPTVFGANPPQFELFVANPPYLGEKGHQAAFEAIRQGSLARFYRARSDLSYYFFHRALDWSAAGAISAFLTTSYFLTASQAEALRQDLQDRAIIHQLTDFHELRLFPGALGQHNLLTLFERGQNPEQPATIHFCLRKGSISEPELDTLLQAPAGSMLIRQCTQRELFCPRGNLQIQPAGLAILTPALEQVLAKLRNLPQRLSEQAQLHQGLVTGADRLTAAQKRKYDLSPPAGSGIFVLNPEEVTALALPATERALLKPWYKNSDIQAWGCLESPRQWLIYTDRQALLEPKDRLWQHLQVYRPLLAARREVRQGRIPWWQLHWPRQPEIFEGAKLVLPQRSQTCLAAWTDQAWYASADVYLVTSSAELLPWLALWLNSPLAWVWLSCQGKRKGALLELYHTPLSNLPVPHPLPEPTLLKALRHCLAQRQRPDQTLTCALWQQLFRYLQLTDAEVQAVLQVWPAPGGHTPEAQGMLI